MLKEKETRLLVVVILLKRKKKVGGERTWTNSILFSSGSTDKYHDFA